MLTTWSAKDKWRYESILEREIFIGYVNHIIYKSEESGYQVMVMEDDDYEVVVTGIFKGVDEGERLRVEGVFKDHPSYGMQLNVDTFEVLPPDDSKSIERYLGSGAIKGVGEKMAAKIVKKFGADTFRIIEEEPERLTEIKGISERIARQIAEQVYEKKEMRRAMLFLQEYGISDKLAVKIFERYGDGMYEMLKTNPYRMAEDMDGVGFKTADEIAKRAGILVNSEFRIRSGILYELSRAMTEGHTCLPEHILVRNTAYLLQVEADEVKIQLTNLMMDKKITTRLEEKDGPMFVYAPAAYSAENKCAARLHNLNIEFLEDNPFGGAHRKEAWGNDLADLSSEERMIFEKIAQIEKAENITLDVLQREAVVKGIANGVSILTGGPGTGKTTTIHIMLRYFENEQMDIALAAPTGRAAKRMSEACGMEAKTIHRLLEVSGGAEDGSSSGFGRNETYPLEADVIIVDEVSMVDIFLFQALLNAIPQGARLILVGDVDQLPSVGPGSVLKDVIKSGCYATTMLSKIFRQAKQSDIVMNAHRIHDGQMPVINNLESKDFYFLKRDNTQQMYQNIVQLVSDKLPRYVDASVVDIQVMTPMKKGPMGVENLNVVLQQHLNPPGKGKREYHAKDIIFREQDKVMQTKNNYQIEWEIRGKYQLPLSKGQGIFNGDIGIVEEINEYAGYIAVVFDEGKRVEYPFENIGELELAYAITIHKSQGSEYPAVVIPLLGVPGLLTYKNLLYTAVTRAKKCVTLLGSEEIVAQMIRGEDHHVRYTGLCHRIQELERVHMGAQNEG